MMTILNKTLPIREETMQNSVICSGVLWLIWIMMAMIILDYDDCWLLADGVNIVINNMDCDGIISKKWIGVCVCVCVCVWYRWAMWYI